MVSVFYIQVNNVVPKLVSQFRLKNWCFIQQHSWSTFAK